MCTADGRTQRVHYGWEAEAHIAAVMHALPMIDAVGESASEQHVLGAVRLAAVSMGVRASPLSPLHVAAPVTQFRWRSSRRTASPLICCPTLAHDASPLCQANARHLDPWQ